MRYLKYLFLIVVGLALIVVALANRQVVTLSLVPGEMAEFLPFRNNIELPLFLVILGGVVLGLLIGFVWEYLREFRIRQNAGRQKRKLNKLEREVKGLREKTGEGKDDVLALLE